jgi:hypothetical protein
MKRAIVNAMYLAILVAVGNLAFAQDAAPARQKSDDRELLERLQSGGLVLLFRHGATGPDPDRPDAVSGRNPFEGTPQEQQAAYLNCERQRNLSDKGRADLRRIAKAIRQIGVLIGDVYASPMCRTRETAWIIAGEVTASDALLSPDKVDRLQLASTATAEGRNRVLVSHGHIVFSLVPNPESVTERGYVPRGFAHVLEPRGDGDFNVLAELGPDDWLRLAEFANKQ